MEELPVELQMAKLLFYGFVIIAAALFIYVTAIAIIICLKCRILSEMIEEKINAGVLNNKNQLEERFGE